MNKNTEKVMSEKISASKAASPVGAIAAQSSYLYQRHSLAVRLMHWINVLSLTILLMSGLMIFNAHPSLDWGKQSYSGKPSWLSISAREGSNGQLMGITSIAGHEFVTTGLLGVSADAKGEPDNVAFPRWMTIPSGYSLSEGRLWHFFFAWLLVINGALYVANAIWSRHLKRDLLPTGADWRGIGRSIVDHLQFKHPQGEDAKRYNVLQKLAYLAVIFVLLPLIILGGWAMSPWLNSLWPGWVDLLGGRQAARTIHFIIAWLLVAFVFIHVFEVIISGLWNHLRSMITGNYRITAPHHKKAGDLT
jgi:thiosulfate reductase cytochrome b subunit